jgi:hypothetical protein
MAASDLGFVLSGGTVGAYFVNGRAIGVFPGSPADKAGIRVGDRADLRSADTRARMFVAGNTFMTQGEPITIPIENGGVITNRSLVSMPTPLLGRIELLMLALDAIAFSLLAAWVVVGSGTVTAYGLAIYALGQFFSPLLDVFGLWTLPLSALIFVIAALAPLGLVIFALHASDDRLSRPRQVLQWLAVIASIPLLVTALSESIVSVLVPGRGIEVDPRYSAFAPIVAVTASFVILLVRYVRHPEKRARIAWLLPAMLVLLLVALPQPAYQSSLVLGIWNSLPPLIAVVILTYAILKGHLIDVRFVVSRAVVYGCLTSGALALIALLDWVLGGVLASSRLALPIEALTAVGIGFWLNALHGRVENLVETVLFRTRRRAEERLGRDTRGLERSDDPAMIAVALVDEAAGALELASAALFVRNVDGSFSRTSALGWGADDALVLEARDPFVLEIAGADAPFFIASRVCITGAPVEMPGRPRLAVPVRPRGTLGAFALYGSHAGGADLDPAEIQLLARLAEGAAYAYDRVEAAHLRDTIAELRARLAASSAYAEIDASLSRASRPESTGAAAAGGP